MLFLCLILLLNPVEANYKEGLRNFKFEENQDDTQDWGWYNLTGRKGKLERNIIDELEDEVYDVEAELSIKDELNELHDKLNELHDKLKNLSHSDRKM